MVVEVGQALQRAAPPRVLPPERHEP
jgi:hypothetical protein